MNRFLLCLLAFSLRAEVCPGELRIFSPEEIALIREGQGAIYNLEHDRAIEIYQGMVRKNPEDAGGVAGGP